MLIFGNVFKVSLNVETVTLRRKASTYCFRPECLTHGCLFYIEWSDAKILARHSPVQPKHKYKSRPHFLSLKVTKSGKWRKHWPFHLVRMHALPAHYPGTAQGPLPLTCSAASGAIWLWNKGTANCIFLGLLGSMLAMRIRESGEHSKRQNPSGVRSVPEARFT